MTTTTESILRVLDDFAEELDFPGLDNANHDTADSRLHCFRDGDRWALVIEQLADCPGADGLVTMVSAMGDVSGDLLTWLIPIEGRVDSASIPDHVVIRGEQVPIDRAAVEAISRDADGNVPFALLVSLTESHRDALFATAEELRALVAPGLSHLLQVDDWAHPDVYGGPAPSESEAFRQLAEVLASGDRHTVCADRAAQQSRLEDVAGQLVTTLEEPSPEQLMDNFSCTSDGSITRLDRNALLDDCFCARSSSSTRRTSAARSVIHLC